MGVVPVIEGLIELVQENLIAKTNVVSNALTGDILVNVENSFHFRPNQEIVIIDYGYNNSASPHYKIFEYAVVKAVNNTHWITLTSPIVDPSGGWMVSDHAFIQKTIGHSPLYDDRVFYGDREVIPTEEMAITLEPQSLSNEWIYLHGGLSEEYRVGIIIYGKDIDTEEGMKILNKYTDAVYELFNRNIHIDIDSFDTPLYANVSAGVLSPVNGGNYLYIAKTDPITLADNSKEIVPSMTLPSVNSYEIQDNYGVEIDLWVDKVEDSTDDITIPVDQLRLKIYLQDPIHYGTLIKNSLQRSYSTAEFAVLRRNGRYFYDSRIDNIEYGLVQKGSAFIRAARLNWFGKEVTEHRFPQRSSGVPYFPEIKT